MGDEYVSCVTKSLMFLEIKILHNINYFVEYSGKEKRILKSVFNFPIFQNYNSLKY